jgi:predicted Zn-dependent peptidase
MNALTHAADTTVITLPNGVRVLTIVLPHLASVNVSVFVRTGSHHESRRRNGISHVVEHMAFKGTHSRSCQQINLDAERLGADVNAHTDKDHTAYHMRGLAQHAGVFVRMLGDIVRNSVFPEAELERERQVILHEYTEDEDDALTQGYKLFDRICFGSHSAAQPVIGVRRNIERFTRQELLDYVHSQYSGANVIVAVAGPVDPQSIAREAEAVFGSMPAGTANRVSAPAWLGGLRTHRQAGCSQTHVVLGFPAPALLGRPQAAIVAAAVLGEGMSSPLLDTLRERRGLVYYAASSVDVTELAGQFMIEASTSPEHLDAFFEEVNQLLRTQAESIAPVDLERARNQLAMRSLRTFERPQRRLEAAALDLYVFGHIRSRAEWLAGIDAVSADQVRAEFARLLGEPVAVAIAGKVPAHAKDRALERLAALGGRSVVI